MNLNLCRLIHHTYGLHKKEVVSVELVFNRIVKIKLCSSFEIYTYDSTYTPSEIGITFEVCQGQFVVNRKRLTRNFSSGLDSLISFYGNIPND